MDTGFDPAAFLAMTADHGHHAMVPIAHVDHGEDWVELSLRPDPALAGEPDGMIASGPLMTMLDMASAMAVWRARGRFGDQATMDMRIDYLRAPALGRALHGRARCERLTRRVAFVRGAAHDGDPDDPVAHLACTFMLLDAG